MSERKVSRDWNRVETWARAQFSFKEQWPETQSLAYDHELGGYGVEALVAALRDLGTVEHGGWTWMPPIAVIRRRLAERSAVDVDALRTRFEHEFQSASRIYGVRIAREFFDPHGRHPELKPVGHDSERWGKARKQLLELNVLGDRNA